jgi:hypothetical protein
LRRFSLKNFKRQNFKNETCLHESHILKKSEEYILEAFQRDFDNETSQYTSNNIDNNQYCKFFPLITSGNYEKSWLYGKSALGR